ncbi:hypothetical protein FACS1894163_05100 [Spirochaetia bacterium]|nr:hypothetical protein FACS1894163_05100 [Spirochaetia bacterium]
MKKLLIYHNKSKSTDRRILEPTDYHSLWNEYRNDKGNSGNKLWLQTIVQCLTSPDIVYDYLTDGLTSEVINSEYDAIIAPRGNMFGIDRIYTELQRLTNEFKKIRIPIYIVGVGAQAPDYKDINWLYLNIKKDAADFINTVYETGGEFGLRGYFTKELFDKLGFKDAAVIGCPSMYQMGKNLTVQNSKVARNDFKPLLNGNIRYLQYPKIEKVFNDHKDSVFMDQDQFIEILYSSEFQEKNNMSKKNIKELMNKYSTAGINLLCEGRIKLYYDVPTWFNFITQRGYNFSFGQRIHGNIAPILNGIPAVVHYHDSRTRELAEFFNIPMIDKIPKNKDLYDIYLDADYTRFNKEFESKFENFKNFLAKCNITESTDNKEAFKKIQNNIVFDEPIIINQQFIDKLSGLTTVVSVKRMAEGIKIKEHLKILLSIALPYSVRHLLIRFKQTIVAKKYKYHQ